MNYENLSLEQALDSAYSRGWSDFKDEDLAEEIAIEVADEFMQTWQQKMADQPRKEGGYNPALNPAYYLDQLITLQTKRRKDEFIRKHREGKKALSTEDFWFWFIEDLLDYAKKHKSPYMATAMLMVLCEYQSPEIHKLYGYVAQSRDMVDYSIYRRYKLEKIHPHMNKRYGTFTEIRDAGINERYVKDVDAEPYLEMFKSWLEQLTPMYPECSLPDSFSYNPNEIEKRYIGYNVTGYPDEVERKRKHIMQCPKCLTKLMKAARFQDWTKSFAPPKIKLQGPDLGNNGLSFGRAKPRKFNPQSIGLVKKILGKRNIRRQRLSLNSLFVAVDNGKPQKVSPDQTIEIHLEDGDSTIRVSGKDWRGRLLLDTHLISWDGDLAEEQPVRYITNLRGGLRLEFYVTYQTDELGDLSGGTARIVYAAKPDLLPSRANLREPIWPTLAKAAAYLVLAPALCLAAYVLLLKPPTENHEAGNANLSSSETNPSSDPNFLGNRIAPSSQASTSTTNATESNDNSKKRNEVVQNSDRTVSEPRPQTNKHPHARKAKPLSQKPRPKQGDPQIDILQGQRFLESSNITRSRRDRALSLKNNNLPSRSVLMSVPPAISVAGIIANTDNKPIPFAKIIFKVHGSDKSNVYSISSGEVGAVSDSAGRFAIPRRYVRTGHYDYVVRKKGFETAGEKRLKLERGAIRSIYIKLKPERKAKY
jgi:hypothetical protein